MQKVNHDWIAPNQDYGIELPESIFINFLSE